MSLAARVLTGLLCLWASCLWTSWAWAALPETPRFRRIGVAEGVPSSYVVALARDRAGYLWLATSDGLARYDGIGFRIWRNVPGNADSLPGNTVQALYIDAKDRIWVATESGGLSVLDPQRRHFHHFRMADHKEIGSDDTWAIAGRDDSIWFGTYGGGLHRMIASDDGSKVRITRFMPLPADPHSLPDETVLNLAFDAEGSLWVATVRGIARWTGHDFERILLPGAQPAPMVFSLTRDGDGIWAGTSVGVFRRDRAGHWTAPRWSSMFERPNAMMAVARDHDGQLWIGSQRGLWRTHAEGIPEPVRDNGHGIARQVQSLLLQDDGALWAPIPGVGLGYLRADWRQLAQFSRAQGGLSGELYRAVAPARAGGIWLANYSGAPERLAADGSVVRLPQASVRKMKDTKFTSIVETDDGIVWTGSRHSLIRIGEDGRIREWLDDADMDPPLPGLDGLRIARDGSLWLSCSGGGVQQRDAASGKILRNFPAGSYGLGDADIESLEFSPDNELWIAGAGGVSRWIPVRDRFEPLPMMGNSRVYGLAFDGANVLWLSRLTGLEQYRRERGKWRLAGVVGPMQDIPAIEAAGLRIDRSHRIWLSTTRGLFRWDPLTRQLRQFGVQDGLSSQEFESHSIALTASGVLAATTVDGGVVMIDTNVQDPLPRRPALALDEVALRRNGRWEPVPIAENIELAQQTELRVRTRLLAYEDPQANRYASRLERFDRGWIAQDNNGERIFSGLKPGRYVLHLRATDAAGNLSADQVLRWWVLPPWWRTPWALLAFAGLAVLLAWWLARAYRERLKQRHVLQLVEHKREIAEQASLAKTRFLATLGHEVRTPMTGVLGMSELLLGTSLDGRQRNYTESIRRAGNHLLRLVNDALDLARIEAGKLELAARPFAVRDLIYEVTELMSPLAAQRGLEFRASVADAAPQSLLGDRTRVEQILLNLLGNAIKFTERGEIALLVDLLRPRGLCLEVVDTGPGLNHEQCARIFQRFEQAEGVRTAARYGGSGLGLTISQELAVAMGGTIIVASTPGQGTRFRVELPLHAADTPAVKPTALATKAHAAGTRSLHLLLVEDDPTVAEVIGGLLRTQGHQIVHVAHGLAALVEAAARRFDAALLDLDLPGIDGLALARQLRAKGFTAPLLAVTARADADAEPAAHAAGFDGFLRKPITGEMLATMIEAIVCHPPAPDRAYLSMGSSTDHT